MIAPTAARPEATTAGALASWYHPGELAVQQRMRQSEMAERIVGMVDSGIPAGAVAFLLEQPMIVVAAADDAGRVWASPITGRPGFAHADSRHTVGIDALPVPGDPLRAALQRRRRPMGMTALEPQTRRRLRLNGVAEPVGRACPGIRIHVEQVYSNCPRYISRRHIERVQIDPPPPVARGGTALDTHQRKMIEAADAFFVGSADSTGDADASNRGGNAGFVEVLAPNRLRWPDYHGNAMFGTLGNIYRNPRCGLLFIGWQSGTTLQLTGTAQLLFDTPDAPPGAQCLIEFTAAEVVETTDASPFRWSPAEPSPTNPPVLAS